MTSPSGRRPVYPTWIRSNRIVLFWSIAVSIVLLSVGVASFWHLRLALAALALPFVYIAVVLTWTSHRLGPDGDDIQRQIHQLLIDAVGQRGRLLDVGCGSGQLVIRCAKLSPDEHVGLDYWGDDWEYTKSQAERNAAIEGVPGLQFLHGSASRLPFPDGHFGRVTSCLTFHEVRDTPDKTVSVGEALRVLQKGGRFAFVDLFDDPQLYNGREHVLSAIARAGGQAESARLVSELLHLRFPLNLGKVLKYAVLVTGIKRSPNDSGCVPQPTMTSSR